MTHKHDLKPSTTYATEANAIAAIEKWCKGFPETIHYTVVRGADGRWFPICMHDTAVRLQMFTHFVTIAG